MLRVLRVKKNPGSAELAILLRDRIAAFHRLAFPDRFVGGFVVREYARGAVGREWPIDLRQPLLMFGNHSSVLRFRGKIGPLSRIGGVIVEFLAAICVTD